MYTQSAPSLMNALSGYLPDSAVRAVVQALGNCQQPLTHRGAVNLSSPQPTNRNGVLNSGSWNPQVYQNTFPQNSSQYYYEAPNIGGYSNGDWYSTNYQGSQFSFPTNQEFAANSYYGGPTFNVGGNSFFENTYADNANYQNLTSNNITARNITLQQINDQPLPPPYFSPSQIGQAYPDFGDINNTFSSFSQQAQGKRSRKKFVTSVDVQGSVQAPYISKAELQSDCTIKLTRQDVTVSLDLNNDAPTKPIDYLAP
jgi:hypothetical protein